MSGLASVLQDNATNLCSEMLSHVACVFSALASQYEDLTDEVLISPLAFSLPKNFLLRRTPLMAVFTVLVHLRSQGMAWRRSRRSSWHPCSMHRS